MEAGKVANWIQVGANVGILGSLLLLGSQIYQGSELSRLDLYAGEEDAYLAVWTASAGEEVAATLATAIDDPKSLSTADMIALDAYYQSIISNLWRREYLHEIGVFDEPIDAWSSIVRRNFSNKFTVAWWKERRQGMEEMVATRQLVDDVVASLDVDDQSGFYSNIRQSLLES